LIYGKKIRTSYLDVKRKIEDLKKFQETNFTLQS